MRLPIKSDGLVFLAGGVEPVFDFATGEVSVDKDTKQPFYKVHLMVIVPGEPRPEVWPVKVVGEQKGVLPGVPVHVVGLAAMTWEQGDRHGLAFRAESITPAVTSTSKQAA